MAFEWDPEKSEQNRRKHGFSFGDVTGVFADEQRVTFADARQDYGEDRWITFGLIEGRLFAAAYTLRGDVVRIISARKANSRERRRYDAYQETDD